MQCFMSGAQDADLLNRRDKCLGRLNSSLPGTCHSTRLELRPRPWSRAKFLAWLAACSAWRKHLEARTTAAPTIRSELQVPVRSTDSSSSSVFTPPTWLKHVNGREEEPAHDLIASLHCQSTNKSTGSKSLV